MFNGFSYFFTQTDMHPNSSDPQVLKTIFFPKKSEIALTQRQKSLLQS